MNNIIITKPIECAGGFDFNYDPFDFEDVTVSEVYRKDNISYIVLAGLDINVRDFLEENFSEDEYDFDEIIRTAKKI